jgi:hypothetical protein
MYPPLGQHEDAQLRVSTLSAHAESFEDELPEEIKEILRY